MKHLIKAAKICCPEQKGLHGKVRDILIENGLISKIAVAITVPKTTKTIRDTNLHVSLGWFDSSVSFGEPGYEERETLTHGLTVAAKSGFTDIVLNADTLPIADTGSGVAFLVEKGKGGTTSLHVSGSLTKNGKGQQLAELFDMYTSGAVTFCDHKKSIANANLLKIALLYAQNFNGLVCSFPLDTKIAGTGIVNEGVSATQLGLKGIPSLAEELQIARDLHLLEYTGGKLHIPTISTSKSVKLIAEAKKKGLDVSCSVAIHNMALNDSVLSDFDSQHKVLPPLRDKTDTKALIKGVKDGVIDFVSCDHSPQTLEGKQVELEQAAYGSIGLETAFASLQPLLGLDTTIKTLTAGRARFGLATPELKEGQPACLSIFNPDTEVVVSKKQLLSTCKNSIFLGHKGKGKVIGTFNNNALTLSP